MLVESGRERAEPHLGAPLDRRHLLVQLRRALGQLGHGLVQPANRPAAASMLCWSLPMLCWSRASPLVLGPAGPPGSGPRCRPPPAAAAGPARRSPRRVPTSADSECSSASGATCVRSNSMCSASASAQPGGRWRGPVEVTGQPVEPDGQPRDLPLADLLDQPLEPFHPLADLLQRARVRPLVRDVVLNRPRQQLAHAVGGACLVSAKQEVVTRLIHDAPSEGVACPAAARDQSGRRQDPPTLVAPRNQLCTESENARQVVRRGRIDESAQRYYCSGLALTSVEC